MHVCSPLLRLVPGFGMHFAKHFSRTVCVGRGGRGDGWSGSAGICGGRRSSARRDPRFGGSRSRASRERTVKNSCAYAFASSAWTWCITASEFWPSILNEDVARARRVVANRRSEEWNECDCREELGIGNITNIMTKCPYVFSNPNGRLTDSDRTAASRSRRKAVVPTRTRATRASSVRPNKQSARG